MSDSTTNTHLLPHTNDALRAVVFQTIGAASVCWSDMAGQGVFKSARARGLGENLLAQIEELAGWTKPRLGLATTRELVDELACRFGNEDSSLPDYRTVGSE